MVAALFPVLLLGMWILVSLLVSTFSGWRLLSEHYAATRQVSGERFRFQSGRFGGNTRYSGCLTLGAGPDGLYLAVLPFFRVGHPPLIIPWSDIRAREHRTRLFSVVELEFAKAPGTSLRIYRRLAESLFDAAGYRVPVEPDA